ncbi:hypothetical protein FA15DRAFT_586483 [Coprinopsis marcescibilis]|uniref:Uncharacterized protein n=1 Tax=Coprinopsis marcescibilis TaxID=230819 RepID=A0A5C3L3V1_COPMA|nr:hypothetical protein FA15DRAFT_586483 [Coprinopsis marcescibilis]
MSHFSEQQRPGMRRKPSAQNLLSSFKPSNSSSSASIPPPLNLAPAGSSSGALSFSSAGTGSTPTSSTPLAREWDAQSLHSDVVGGAPLGGAGSPQMNQGMSVEYLRELVNKRIITLTYLRSVHEGRSHWFHTIQISRADLDRKFNNNNPDTKKRTTRFAILALSLSGLLDINQPQDLLRSLLNTVTEYDQAKEEGSDKSKIRLFKPKNRRGTNAPIPEFSGSFSESSDTSYLFTPHIPFPLDYHETLMSLIDVLSEVYNKISKLLGPSPFPSQGNMMGPLGQLAPLPGVSYLFTGDNMVTAMPQHYNPRNTLQGHGFAPDQDISNGLWGLANASWNATGGPSFAGGLQGPPPINWPQHLGDMVLKIDGKLKKVTSLLLRDLDELARTSILDELASLDPLLRNTRAPNGQSGGYKLPLYEYEAM